MPRPWPRPRSGPRDGYPGQPVSSGLYDVDVETSDVDGLGWTRGMWVVSFPTTSIGFGPGPNKPVPATAFVLIDGRTGAWIMADVS